MKVPLLDVKAQNAPLRGALLAPWPRDGQRGLHSGPEVEAFEKELAAVLGVARPSAFRQDRCPAGGADGSGRGPRRRSSDYAAVLLRDRGLHRAAGGRPVFADIEPESFNWIPRPQLQPAGPGPAP